MTLEHARESLRAAELCLRERLVNSATGRDGKPGDTGPSGPIGEDAKLRTNGPEPIADAHAMV